MILVGATNILLFLMRNLNTEVKALFDEQLLSWPLAKNNFEGLKTVKTRTFNFENYAVTVQFNPARIVSSGAKVDAKTIAERKCFLCAENRPAEQNAVDAGNYWVLVNPFPIFPEHFTITHKQHIPQQINAYFSDMLELSKAMSDYVLFYNGPRCGASAPDHMHFQAGTKDFLPLVSDYARMKEQHAELMVETLKSKLYQLKNYGRELFVLESDDSDALLDAFAKLYSFFASRIETDDEPMMNIVCSYSEEGWQVMFLARKAFRPWQYTAENDDERLLVSPATVEMSGMFITPIEAHFEKITAADVQNIFEQTSF